MGNISLFDKTNLRVLLFLSIFLLITTSFFLGYASATSISFSSVDSGETEQSSIQEIQKTDNVSKLTALKNTSIQTNPTYAPSETRHKSLQKTTLSDVSLRFNIQTTSLRFLGAYMNIYMSIPLFLATVFSGAGFLFGLALLAKYRTKIDDL